MQYSRLKKFLSVAVCVSVLSISAAAQPGRKQPQPPLPSTQKSMSNPWLQPQYLQTMVQTLQTMHRQLVQMKQAEDAQKAQMIQMIQQQAQGFPTCQY